MMIEQVYQYIKRVKDLNQSFADFVEGGVPLINDLAPGPERAAAAMRFIEDLYDRKMERIYNSNALVDDAISLIEAERTKKGQRDPGLQEFAEKVEKIEKGYYAIDSAHRLNRCFMEFIETAMAGIIQATTEQEKAAQADELVEGLHIHLEELYVGNDLIEKAIAELDEAMVYYRQKRQEVAGA